MRRSSYFFGKALVFAGLIAAAASLKWWNEARHAGQAAAIDGDSLRLDGVEIRLAGIDAPEFDQPCRREGRSWPCGRAAKAQLAKELAQGPALCVSSAKDRYGRVLAKCSVNGVEINAAMVRNGMAIAYGGYEREEAEARDAKRGVWSSEFEQPQSWRREHRRDGQGAIEQDAGGRSAPLPPQRPPS